MAIALSACGADRDTRPNPDPTLPAALKFDTVKYTIGGSPPPTADQHISSSFGRLTVIFDASDTYYVVGDCGWRDVYRAPPRTEALAELRRWVGQLGQANLRVEPGCTMDGAHEYLSLWAESERVGLYVAEEGFGSTYCFDSKPPLADLAPIAAKLTGLPVDEGVYYPEGSLASVIEPLPRLLPPEAAVRLSPKYISPEPAEGETVHTWPFGTTPPLQNTIVEDPVAIKRLWQFFSDARSTQTNTDWDQCPVPTLVDDGRSAAPVRVALWPWFPSCLEEYESGAHDSP